MPLREDPKFKRDAETIPQEALQRLLDGHQTESPIEMDEERWLHCGYESLLSPAGVLAKYDDVKGTVDNGFRLGPAYGFEQRPVVVTTGLRSSRFAPILFWEVLHVLAPGGLWIDIDKASRAHGTPLIRKDFLNREYFRDCLTIERRSQHGPFVAQTLRKTGPTALSARIADGGWTFGILTSGPSPRAAQMASAILALDLPAVEVIFCGPTPADAPTDPRIRTIDLERPEPRGWITRKKNLLATAAEHENLCLLHDRYVITPQWAAALRSSGSCFSIETLPQIFYADIHRRHSQRYADYQVLHQSAGIDRALDSFVFAGERVWYAPYDDFYETAFCCGGLYVAKKSLWAGVQQNEALFHCEWEDIVFGLECQKRGIPHRVNRTLIVESMSPHPMALTRFHDMDAPDSPQMGRVHIGPRRVQAAAQRPELFKPAVAVTRDSYYEKVVQRFNAIPGLTTAHRIEPADVAECQGLADFWRVVEARVKCLPLSKRQDIADVLFFLSDTIYNWPNCEIQTWLLANEQRRRSSIPTLDVDHVVGWGTGSLFRSTYAQIGRRLSFVIDSNESLWGTFVEGLEVKPPSALAELDPRRTVVIVFSCYLHEITTAARAFGPYPIVSATEAVADRPFSPLTEMVGYFAEVERYYPVLFHRTGLEAAA